MNIVVTGGCGFIGSHLVERLVSDGHMVRVIDDLSADNSEYYTFEGVKYSNVSILDRLSIEPYFEDIDVVYHLAASARIGFSLEDPEHAVRSNIIGTLNVLQACRKYGIKRIIYSSTSSVYGNPSVFPTDEQAPTYSLNPYAASKLGGEELVRCYTKSYDLDSCILRYFNVYGERSPIGGRYSLVIGKFLNQRRNNEPLTVVGDGQSKRDFIYVKDVVSANICAMNHRQKLDAAIFNVGFGNNFKIVDIAKFISSNIVYLQPSQHEVRSTCANISKCKLYFNWVPSTHLLDWLSMQ